MYINPKPLLTLSLAFGISIASFAQTDTTHTELDLGRLKIDKAFTQSITIKGTDLERMPFTNLAEAINVWSYGYYTNKNRLTYAIDGIIVNDVNAYSPYDIEEVTIVQNALAQVSGATGQGILVLIKTRKGGSKSTGITVAGQSYLVKGDNPTSIVGDGRKSETNFYHSYQVSAYQKGKRFQFGLSANYLRDVTPTYKDSYSKTQTPYNTDRFRINGWATAQLGTNHELTLRINATPQITDFQRDNAQNSFLSKFHAPQTLLAPSINLRSKLTSRLTNELSVAYGWQKGSYRQETISFSTPGTTPSTQVNEGHNRSQQVLVMDHISYRAALNKDWSVEPALNMSFRYLKQKLTATIANYNNGLPSQISTSTIQQEGRLYLLTPSVNLRYRNSFNLQGGLVANISKTYGQDVNKLLPFVSASIDVLQLASPANPTSLKLFGSFAETDHLGDVQHNFDNIGLSTTPFTGPFTGTLVVPGRMPENSFWNWQTGVRLSTFNNRLTANYTFEKRTYTAQLTVYTPMGYQSYFPDITASSHHFAIQANVLETSSLSWRTGINATSIKNKFDNEQLLYSSNSIVGDINSDKTAWTGGWTNRLSVHGFIAGLDLLYYVNKDQLPTIPGDSKVSALTVQNVYAGYTLTVGGARTFELYADCRNLAQHNTLKLGGNRKYYGLGAKVSL